jgi:formate dehydrogenase (coenzyme F420) beta subunit
LIDKVRQLVVDLLDSGRADAVLALANVHANVQPYLYKKGDSLDSLALWPKYSMGPILKSIQAAQPDMKLAVVARGCDDRALVELAKRGQIDLNNVQIIGLACTADEATECECANPYPANIDVGNKVDGVASTDLLAELKGKSYDDRLIFWKQAFDKCIKCYGCRNACPLCICEECILEDDSWVKAGEIPPPFPIFHLIRAYHLSDKCVECGECQNSCPMDIPLTSLYALIRNEFNELFDYIPGAEIDRKSPLVTSLEEDPIREETA